MLEPYAVNHRLENAQHKRKRLQDDLQQARTDAAFSVKFQEARFYDGYIKALQTVLEFPEDS